jgi:predicted ABC-type exoprotein transport system permease subunit
MEALFGIMTAFGLSASAGLNAYIPLLMVGVIAHYTDWIKLNPPYDTLANPWVLIVVGLLLIVEMLADKIPAVNHVNDIIQTGIRPAAGAIIFAASAHAITNVHPVIAIICGLLVSGSIHVVKSAAIRPAVTATTGGAANVPVSIAEDVAATAVSFLSIVVPVLVTVVLVILVALIIWWFWRRARRKRQAGL